MSEAIAANVAVVAVSVAVVAVAAAVWREAAAKRRHRARRGTRLPAQFVDGRRLLAERLDEAQPGGRSRDRALLLAYLHGDIAVPGATGQGREASVRRLLRRLGQEFGPTEVYRLTSQQFAVVSKDAAESRAARGVAKRILALTASEPGAGPASVGVAVREPEAPAARLWADADAALRCAAERGAGSVVLHGEASPGLPVVTSTELDRVRELLDDERVAVTFQPVHALHSQRLLGFQAQSRPASRYGFDGLAQAFAAATRLGRAAELDAVCRKAVLDEGPGFDMPPGTLLFMTVSAAGLVHPSLQARALLPAVRAAGLSSERVVLELTEPSAGDPDLIARRVRELAALGFKIALGSLGARDVALQWLRRIPADFLKLDATLLADSATDRLAEALAHAVCVVAHRTGASVIADGIDSDELLTLAKRLPQAASESLRIHAGQGDALAAPSTRPLDRRSRANATPPGRAATA